MRRSLALAAASLGLALQFLSPSQAASLRVAPVVLDLRAPTAASTIRIWNDARRPINVQIRVFRWVQRNGEDAYEQTNDVVASPPITTLRPGGENLVRIVRTSKRPVDGEESYRLVVDELPDLRVGRQAPSLLSFAIPFRCSLLIPTPKGRNPSGRSSRAEAALW